MKASYKKLWKILIDRNMKKKDLMEATGVSPSTMAKLTAGENVNLDVLRRICEALKLNIGDIMDFIPEE